MTNQDRVTAAILIIGDEILSGRTVDKNINHIARHLSHVGIILQEVRIVPDEQSDIVQAVNHLRQQYDYLFTTGGIGPTHDDITADCIAAAFGVEIDVDERAVTMMLQRYRKEDLTDERLRMARIPAGAELIDNDISHTPGFRLDNVIVMAGIPSIMQQMLQEITPHLRTGVPIQSQTLRVIAPESQIAAGLREIAAQFDGLSIGSYPFFKEGVMGANLVLRSTDVTLLETASVKLRERLAAQNIDCQPIADES